MGRAEAAVELRAVLESLVRGLQSRRGADGLTPPQTSVLSLLETRGPMTASNLAAVEQIRPQSIATILSQLFRRRLVTRSSDPSDARSVLVSVTASGRQAVLDARAEQVRHLERAIAAALTADELEQFAAVISVLERLSRHV